MTFPASLALPASIPPNLWVGGLLGGFFLCAKAVIEGLTARAVQRLMNEGQTNKLRSDELLFRMKLDHEERQEAARLANEEKEREHKTEDRKSKQRHEMALVLINVPARTTLMAVA